MAQKQELRPSEKLILKTQRQERREIARNLKAQGDPPEKIAAATGLSPEDVKKL